MRPLLYSSGRISLLGVMREARAAVPPRATPPLPFMAGEPTEKSLFQIQKKFGGGNLKNAKGFSGGARSSFAGIGGGA
jgi:hypothetical protein